MMVFTLANLKTDESPYYTYLKRIFDILNQEWKLKGLTPYALVQFFASVANIGDLEGLISQTLLPTMVKRIVPITNLLDSSSTVCLLWAVLHLDFFDEELIKACLKTIRIEELNSYENYLLYLSLLYTKKIANPNIEQLIETKYKPNFEKISKDYQTFEKKLATDIDDLENFDSGMRMTSDQIRDEIRRFCVEEDIHFKKDAVVKGIVVPLYWPEKNVAVFIYGRECYLRGEEELLGIFRSKQKVLSLLDPTCKIISISVKEYLKVGQKEAKKVAEWQQQRKNYILEQLRNSSDK